MRVIRPCKAGERYVGNASSQLRRADRVSDRSHEQESRRSSHVKPAACPPNTSANGTPSTRGWSQGRYGVNMQVAETDGDSRQKARS
jgi:hypothetical protein